MRVMRRYRRMTDAQLLAASRTDGQAFGVFYDRHFDTVLAFVRGRVSRPDVALDLTSETFARALQAVPGYEDRDDVPAIGWLLSIARNLVIDAQRRARVADDARVKLGMRALELTDGDLERIDEVSALGSERERLAAALASLPEDQRHAVLARVADDVGYPQIAAEVGCSESVVRKRVSRGLASLRAKLQERIS